MTTVGKATLALGTFFLLVGCADGGNGDKGLVRFSQVVNFVETSDFSPPLVATRTVLIRLEHTSVDQRGYPELNLEVTGGAAQVLPLGFAQYAVRLDEEKAYRFRAKEGTRELDALTVTAKKAAGLRFHSKARVVTLGRTGQKTCAKGSEVELAELTLAPNQEAALFVVPVDGEGKAMLGLLQLSGKMSRADVQLDTPLFFEGGSANALTVKPTLASGPLGDAQLEVTEPLLGTLTQKVGIAANDAVITCD
ncbi:MAG: hypothetical protein IAE78_27450 [Myxococcus sp.]|nr:hypothetical protein [Myxococcus sp.]